MKRVEVGFDLSETEIGATIGRSARYAQTVAAEQAKAVDENIEPISDDIELGEMIGEGGMGRVLVARQNSLRREVAVKTSLSKENWALDLLVEEARTTGQLEHPGIVPVHALTTDEDNRPAIVMKRIEGVPWDELAAKPNHSGWQGWQGTADDRLLGHVQLTVQLCDAVHFAHSKGIVHRDIKLANVLVGGFGDLYLADWGIATDVGTVDPGISGTPGCIAPEMTTREAVDARTDVYLLGATLHHALTGKMRHPAKTIGEAIGLAELSEPHLYAPTLPAPLGAILNKACNREPQERFETARELRDTLIQFTDDQRAAAMADEARALVEKIEALENVSVQQQDRDAVERMIAQASFGFRSALKSWQGDESTLASRDRLEAIVFARRKRASQLEREAYERDPSVGAFDRALAFALVGFAGLGVTLVIAIVGLKLRTLDLFVFGFAVYLVVVVVTVALRRQLFRTTYSRRLVGLLHVGFMFMLGQRLLGLAEGAAVPVVLARDSIMLSAACAVAAALGIRGLIWLSACFAASFLVCALAPQHAVLAFAISASVVAFVAAGFQWSGDQSEPEIRHRQ